MEVLVDTSAPISPEEAAWVDGLLGGKGLR